MTIRFDMPVVNGPLIHIEGQIHPNGAFVLSSAQCGTLDLTSILHTTGYENVQAAAYNHISGDEAFCSWQQSVYGNVMQDCSSLYESKQMKIRLEYWLTPVTAH